MQDRKVRLADSIAICYNKKSKGAHMGFFAFYFTIKGGRENAKTTDWGTAALG